MNIKIMLSTVVFLFMTICVNTHAQSNSQKEVSSQAIIVSGYITDWIENTKKYSVDGFNLQTNDAKLMIMFPSHMGSELRQEIKTGNTITVNGFKTKDSLGVTKINMVSVTIEGKTIQVSPPFLAGAKPVNEIINGGAKIRELQKNVDGKISGYILDNKTILRLDPNISNELVRMLVVGTTISYSGIKSSSGSGEDAWASYTIIRCQTIFVNGKQYLTQ